MKVAVLNADKTSPEICEEIASITDLYKELFSKEKLELDFFDVQEKKFPVYEKSTFYHAYLITGSRFSVYNKIEWIESLKDFVRKNQNKKFLGICFGHQLIADALGGKVEKSKIGWNLGVKKINITECEPWMLPSQNEINMIFNHQDQVMCLPKGSKLLAGNEECPIQMYTINQNILCMQFHPEFTEKYQKALMYKKRDRIDQNKIKNAESSYANKTDQDIVIKWIANFIKY